MTFSRISLFLTNGLLALALVACSAAATTPTEVSPDTGDGLASIPTATPAPPTETISAAAEKVDTQAAVTMQESASALSEATAEESATTLTYPLVDTGQGFCYDDAGDRIDCPAEGEAFYGQDAQFTGNAFSFTDNGDGTVTDNVTGLVWQQTPDTNTRSWSEAIAYCSELELGGRDDWRMPTLKELYSIANFSAGWPYLDLDYFDLVNNDAISKDEQYWGDSHYVGKTAEGQYDAAFGVNAATGHIKAYPASVTGPMAKYVRAVAGDVYGENDLVDNADGTISDNATGLMWSQADSGRGMDWVDALAYAQDMNTANYLGYSDWRLPNVKELQSIADYDYAPDALAEAYDGPALDPMFAVSEIVNEAGEDDYPYYWTSTSARFQSTGDFYYAWYVAAGRAVDGQGNDSHGAGAVRFDIKSEDCPAGEGGERLYNYVRLVRGGDITETPDGDPNASDTAPEMAFVGAGGPGGGPRGAPGGQLDLAAVAETLGVTEEALQSAMGEPGQGPPDFAEVAEALGVTEDELMAAMGGDDHATSGEASPPATEEQAGVAQAPAAATDEQPADRPEPPQRPEQPVEGQEDTTQASGGPGGPPSDGQRPSAGQTSIDLAAAAETLGVTEEALTAALSQAGQGPPDFEAAAETLGVTVEALMEALGLNESAMPGGQPPMGGAPGQGAPGN